MTTVRPQSDDDDGDDGDDGDRDNDDDDDDHDNNVDEEDCEEEHGDDDVPWRRARPQVRGRATARAAARVA
jgi:hypothetical protein